MLAVPLLELVLDMGLGVVVAKVVFGIFVVVFDMLLDFMAGALRCDGAGTDLHDGGAGQEGHGQGSVELHAVKKERVKG